MIITMTKDIAIKRRRTSIIRRAHRATSVLDIRLDIRLLSPLPPGTIGSFLGFLAIRKLYGISRFSPKVGLGQTVSKCFRTLVVALGALLVVDVLSSSFDIVFYVPSEPLGDDFELPNRLSDLQK